MDAYDSKKIFRLGARGSALSRWQAEHVAKAFETRNPQTKVELRTYTTRGDQNQSVPLPQIGGKGVFTAELQQALYDGDIDFAVHSQKDLPVQDPEGLEIAAVLERENPADVLVSRGGFTLKTLPQGATIGTSSTRRAAQVLSLRPDLKTIDIRGNVDTRIQKALDPSGPYDAIMLAYAGVARLGRLSDVSEIVESSIMLPAPGQGALAVECLRDAPFKHLLRNMNDAKTEIAVRAERAFLAGLGGGCSLPIAAFAHFEGDMLHLKGCVLSKDGAKQIRVEATIAIIDSSFDALSTAEHLGRELAMQAAARGADRLLLPVA